MVGTAGRGVPSPFLTSLDAFGNTILGNTLGARRLELGAPLFRPVTPPDYVASCGPSASAELLVKLYTVTGGARGASEPPKSSGPGIMDVAHAAT